MVVRGDRLSKSMSAYLIERIERHPLIDVHLGTQLTGLHADGGKLVAVTLTDAAGKAETRQMDARLPLHRRSSAHRVVFAGARHHR